ncbi:MAG: hypothetical protein E6Q92_13330 [Burkholderiaceae bacterium]|nr:MAG: hypothetical protein E6Q92_13330 [Burkholderiaceae bacterium]
MQVLGCELHGRQGGQGATLHFQGLDAGVQHPHVVLEPELDGLELVDALGQLLGIEGGRGPGRGGGFGAGPPGLEKVHAGEQRGEVLGGHVRLLEGGGPL